MASKIHRGQRLDGRKTFCNVLHPLSKEENLWLASDPKTKVVLIKTAPSPRLMNEIEALELCQGHKSIQFLDKTLYDASCEQKLDRCDIKRAVLVKTVLDGLAVLHAHKRAHTDIKPNNILANNGTGNARFGTIQLGDFGDS